MRCIKKIYRMSAKRVKVRLAHPRKKFYEGFLSAWRDDTDEQHQKSTLYKALHNLRKHPLEVDGIMGLKQIMGIGEKIALQCDAAWNVACSNAQDVTLRLRDVETFTAANYRALLAETKGGKKRDNKQERPKKTNTHNLDDEFSEPIPRKIPRISKAVSAPSCSSSKAAPPPAGIRNEFLDSDDDIVEIKAADTAKGKTSGRSAATEPSSSSQRPEGCEYPSDSLSHEVQYLSTRPHEKVEVILICDNREFHGNKRGKEIVGVLTGYDIRFELRSLSIGDYLWVARKIDGSEMVLDWVVERKTYDDLVSSIKKGRYGEQKQRLLKAPMKNRVYLIEGNLKGDTRVSQALETTMAKDNFLIQRCNHPKDTARFLKTVTDRLAVRAATQNMQGVRFEDLQELSKKERAETVQETWIRQLTVCPGMSTDRAKTVAASFPSLPALVDAYSKDNDKPTLISRANPMIPKALSAQLSKFFAP